MVVDQQKSKQDISDPYNKLFDKQLDHVHPL